MSIDPSRLGPAAQHCISFVALASHLLCLSETSCSRRMKSVSQNRKSPKRHRALQALRVGHWQGGVSCISGSLSGVSGAFPTSIPLLIICLHSDYKLRLLFCQFNKG